MGEARLSVSCRLGAALGGAAALAGLLAPSAGHAAGPSRFASYDSEPQCIAAGTIPAPLCRSAFANARSEYEAKTPAFASEALCTRRYASCMAWPPGNPTAKASYRPSWDGVDIVDTPSEHSVTPSPGSTGKTIRFAARPLTEEPRPLVIRGAGMPVPRDSAPLIQGRPGRPSPTAPFVEHASGPERPIPPTPMPPPGSGFKLEDGVLTYPAPSRYQPKNLPKVD